ncbi:MAG: hypothetical protein WD875_12615 [Pirellulales bacterium]
MCSSTRILGARLLVAVACTAPTILLAESPQHYLKVCEQRRVDTIFSLRKNIEEHEVKLAAIPAPMTESESKARDDLKARIEWLKARLGKLEDFSQTVFEPIRPSIFDNANAGKISSFGVFERYVSPDSKLVLVAAKIVDGQRLLVDVFQYDRAGATPEKWKHQYLLTMPTAKIKPDDKIEPTGVYEFRVVMRPSQRRGGEPQPTSVVAAVAVNLRPFERTMAEYRKEAQGAFQVREKEWLRERARAKNAVN